MPGFHQIMSKRSPHGSIWRMGRVLCACLLAVAVCVSLAACYPSEFLTQVVIDASADKTDDDLSQAMQLNSPDAETEASNLSALDISEEAKNTTDEENMLVYKSKDSNADDMSAHHSIFDLDPRLSGIEASDGVSFKLADNTDKDWVDHEVTGKSKTKDAKSKGKDKSKKDKGKSKAKKSSAKQKSSGANANTKGKATGSSSKKANKKTGGNGGNGNGSGDGKDDGNNDHPNENQEDGDTPVVSNQAWKKDELEPVYDPSNERSKLKKANHVAATGQAAVLVQAIGGRGALCAMDEATYNGKDSDGYKTTASAFKDVFKEGEELAEGFKDSALKWNGDGSSSADVKSIRKLVETVGADGVIFFESDKASYSERFTDEMRQALETAGIQLVPVDLTTVQGMLDAANAVGEVLSESKELSDGWSSVEMAEEYQNAIKDIVKAVADVQNNGCPGTYGSAYNAKSDRLLKTCWPESNIKLVDATSGTYITSVVATAYDDTASYSPNASGYEFDVSDGVFLAEGDGHSTLAFWLQVAGTMNSSSFGCYDTYEKKHVNGNLFDSRYLPIIPIASPQCQGIGAKRALTGKGALSQVNWDKVTKSSKGHYADELTALASNRQTDGMGDCRMGPGSRLTPYFIVCAYKDKSASDAKDALLKAMRNENSFYYAHPNMSGTWFDVKYMGGTQSVQSLMGTQYQSTISGTLENVNKLAEGGVEDSDVVIENPCGLLGSWTGTSMESVLESVWAANLYSQKADGSDYVPNCDMSKFSVKIGGAQCSTLRDAANAFYKTFYRYNLADKVYKKVVTEEGPGK